MQSLRNTKSYNSENLKSNQLTKFREQVLALFDRQLTELTADSDTNIKFVWDNLFDTGIKQLGSIKLNDQMNISPTRTFSHQVKSVVPDYKTKQLPTAYRCKKSSDKKAPGELNNPRCMSINYITGNIYIADEHNHRVQVFSYNGDYLFMFSEKMKSPRGICVFQNAVFVTQNSGHCVNVRARRETNEELKYHSMLGIGLFTSPRDIKVTRDRVLVLDVSDPCMFIFNSEHLLLNRMTTRGVGKQTNNPYSFDIDRDYNIIMSDYSNDCVYSIRRENRYTSLVNKVRVSESSIIHGE